MPQARQRTCAYLLLYKYTHLVEGEGGSSKEAASSSVGRSHTAVTTSQFTSGLDRCADKYSDYLCEALSSLIRSRIDLEIEPNGFKEPEAKHAFIHDVVKLISKFSHGHALCPMVTLNA